MKLFQRIRDLLDDKESFVCVLIGVLKVTICLSRSTHVLLIDEVESLTAARQAAVSGAEPSDAIRATNALLTQLDALKAYSNVLVLTTSNITDAIDPAFLDRADLKVFIGPPGESARLQILRQCIEELIAKGIVTTSKSVRFNRYLIGGSSLG
jgi:SpoVK/Ycf46/Vps4 family AAA+-type ATPase